MKRIKETFKSSDTTSAIEAALLQARQVSIQPQEDLHYENGVSIVSVDKLRQEKETALQKAGLTEVKTKIYARRTLAKFKVRLEQPTTGQWIETTLTTRIRRTETLATTAITLERKYLNDLLGFRHCVKTDPIPLE